MANSVEIIVQLQDRASNPLSGITGALSNMASVAGGIVAANFIGRIGEGFFNAARTGFDFNRSIENATARLNAFTKDGAVSAGILEQLRNEAAKTPFAFEDMANAGAALLPIANNLNMDLMDLVSTAEILAASNPAEGLEGAAFALKEAASGDFASIIERFNLSRQAINDLKEQGVPNMEIVARAMADMGLDMDLVSGLSTTFDGRLSTLMDTLQSLAGAFTEPIFGVFSGMLGDLQIGLDSNIEAWKTWAASLGQTVADSFQTFKEAWTGQWEDDETIQPIHRFVGKMGLALKEGFDKVGTFLEEWKPKIKTAWEELGNQVDSISKIWKPWNDLVDESGNLMETLWGFIEDVVAAFTGVEREGDKAHKAMGRINDLGSELGGMFDNIRIKVAAFANWLDILRDRWNRWVEAASSAWAALAGFMVEGVVGPPPPGAPAAPPGPGDVPDTSPSSNPNVIVPIPPPPGTANRGGVFGSGVTIYANVNSAIDMHELAYQVARQIQENR